MTLCNLPELSENIKMCSTGIKGITYVVGHLQPNIQEEFDILIKTCSEEPPQACHRRYSYPAEVKNQQCWRHMGVFFDYLIKRELYALCKMKAVDRRAELYKKALQKYRRKRNDRKVVKDVDGVRISINRSNIDEVEDLLASYKYFKNTSKYGTKDVLKHIFKTSMLHMMSYGERTVAYHPDFLNRSNIKDVLKFVKSWKRQGIKINPAISSRFFRGDADFIFDDCIMEIKASMYEPDQNRSQFDRGIYQMILYALGYFYETGRRRKTFKVYNPLLGKMYTLKLNNFNFDGMLQVVDNRPCWEADSDESSSC